VSSAILYLAIVVIWACLLVPRWVRRPHTAFFSGQDAASRRDSGLSDSADGADGAAGTGLGGPGDVGDADGERMTGDSADAPAGGRPGVLRSVGLTGTRRPVTGRTGDDQPEPDTAPLPVITVPRPAQPGTAAEPANPAAAASAPPGGAPGLGGQSRPGRPAHPPISRGKIVQARRRLLTTLVLLATAAVSCTALKLTSWWVCVPPAGMLGLYLLLLRETAVADAEQARWRAEQAHAARQRARARSRLARAPLPDAEIIDISARLGDQLYDQYADAEDRAVGGWPG
jgi:hypothetical protein